MTITLMLLLLLSPVCRADEHNEHSTSFGDELAAEEKQLDADNLDATLERSEGETARSLTFIQAFMASTRGYLTPLIADFKGQAGGEERVDALSLSADLLDQKAEGFRAKAAQAGIKAPKLARDALFQRRAQYRFKDRERDLKRALADAAKAKRRFGKDIVQTDAEKDAFAALDAFTAEMGRAIAVVREALSAGKSSKTAPGQLGQMETDLQNIEREGKFLAVSLKLQGYDKLAFRAPATEEAR